MQHDSFVLHLFMNMIGNYEYDLYVFIRSLVRIEFTLWIKGKTGTKYRNQFRIAYGLVRDIPRLISFTDERREIWNRFLIILEYLINSCFINHMRNLKLEKVCKDKGRTFYPIHNESINRRDDIINFRTMGKRLQKKHFPKHNIINFCNSWINYKVSNLVIIMNKVENLKKYGFYEI